MRRIALAAAIILAAVMNLWAQGAGQLPAWNVLGNPSAAASNARSASLNAMFNGAFCSTANAFVARVGGSWVCQGLGTGLSFAGGNLTVAPPWSSITGTPTTLSGYSITSPLPYAQGGCNATTQTGCTNNIFPTPTRAGDITYWNGSAWVTLPGNNSGTNVLQETAGGVPSWVSGGAGSVNAGGGGIVPSSGSPSTLFVEQMTPGGRLTVSSGVCVPVTDQTAKTSIFYAPCGSEWIPIYDGTDMKLRNFTASNTDTVGLTLALGSNWAANTLYDTFVGLNSGTVTLCTGPAWTNSGAGTSARGSGAGTTQLAIFKGLWTNAVSMTCRLNNTTTFTCAVNQCTYVGTFLTNGSTGTIDLKFGTAAAGCGPAVLSVFNAYNPKLNRATLSATDVSWSYTTATWRAVGAFSGCNATVVVGLALDSFSGRYLDQMSTAASGIFSIGIGVDATNALATRSSSGQTATGLTNQTIAGDWDDVLTEGLHTINAIEKGDGTHATTALGDQSGAGYRTMQLSVRGMM